MQDRHHIQGIREPLPEGETLYWEGRPDRAALLRHVFGIRVFVLYFAVLAIVAAVAGNSGGPLARIAWIVTLGVAFWGLLRLYAGWIVRTTTYAITDRRLLIRKGVALPSVLNIPFGRVKGLSSALYSDGCGDIAVEMAGGRVSWALLWPHARPWKLRKAQPTFRAVPDAEEVGAIVRKAYTAFQEAGGAAELQPGKAELRIMDEDDTIVFSGSGVTLESNR